MLGNLLPEVAVNYSKNIGSVCAQLFNKTDDFCIITAYLDPRK